jgi:hypothetical protein
MSFDSDFETRPKIRKHLSTPVTCTSKNLLKKQFKWRAIGYGDFEGQTINSGHNWRPAEPLIWDGYLLTK